MDLVYLMILSFTVSVETYGLGQQSRHERLINVTSPVYSKTNVQQHDTSSPTRKMINKAASKVEQLPTLDRNNNNKYTDRNKLILKVQDLKSMHQQLIKENKSHDTGNTKENGLLQHIEKQIQLRKMQQQRYRGAYKQLSPKTKKPRQTSYQIIRPKRMFAAAPSNIGQVKSNSPHNSFPQNKIQQPMKQNTVLTQQQLYQSHPKMSNVNNDVLQVQKLHQPFIGSTKASANDVAYLKNFIKQIKPSSSVNVMTKDARSRHILVPLSALTSGQVLNNRMVLSNPYAIPLNKIIRLVPNEVSFKETPKGIQTSTPLPSTSSSTVKATTSSPTSTVKKITTSLTTPPSTSDQESTTPFDFEMMKQRYIQRAVKKQDLEITKLQLEIRALRREEKQNMSQEENDDAQQPRRGKFAERNRVFPYSR